MKSLSVTQIKELLTNKKTTVIQGFKSKAGKKFDASLKLDAQGQISFDFPDRPIPEETTIHCPKCKERKLGKSQWYYECLCGFKIGHTVAQVSLSQEVMQELFTVGRTRQKISGFVSKAGNTFDAYLKYEDEKIQFDFDNAGEPARNIDTKSRAQPWIE